MHSSILRSAFLLLGALTIVACQSGSQEELGVINLAISSGPADASCLRITVTDASGSAGAVRTLPLTPGRATTGTLSGLPLGSVSVKAEAFNVRCSSLTATVIPSWVSDPASAVLTPGTPVAVALVMERAGQISISVDWNTGGVGGASGVGGTSGTGGAGGGLGSVAQALNGQMLLAPCLRDTAAAICANVNGVCPPLNSTDRALSGVLLTDRTLTLGGTPGTPYTITLHVQGEVEAKMYTGAVDQNGMSLSPAADGFATGGTPTTADAYGVYMLRVTNPDATQTSYFLNSLIPPGVSNHTTYGIDYFASIQAQGGATVRLVAADSNCSQIKNCGPAQNDGTVCAAPIVLTTVEPVARASNPTFNFDAPFNGQWISMVVTGVTSP